MRISAQKISNYQLVIPMLLATGKNFTVITSKAKNIIVMTTKNCVSIMMKKAARHPKNACGEKLTCAIIRSNVASILHKEFVELLNSKISVLGISRQINAWSKRLTVRWPPMDSRAMIKKIVFSSRTSLVLACKKATTIVMTMLNNNRVKHSQ
jgi:hypothetical protein